MRERHIDNSKIRKRRVTMWTGPVCRCNRSKEGSHVIPFCNYRSMSLDPIASKWDMKDEMGLGRWVGNSLVKHKKIALDAVLPGRCLTIDEKPPRKKRENKKHGTLRQEIHNLHALFFLS